MIANWANGYPLITERMNHKGTGMLVSFNCAASSHKGYDLLWHEDDSDGVNIVYNSLVYVAEFKKRARSKMNQNMLKYSQQGKLCDITITCSQ